MDNIKISRIDDMGSAKESAGGYPHSVIYQISEVFVDVLADKADKIVWDEVTEAWFFDRHSELHFYRTGDALVCTKAEEPAGADHVVKRTYAVADAASRGRTDKKVLEVREYLDFDEDGQCFVAYTRLADIRAERPENGYE